MWLAKYRLTISLNPLGKSAFERERKKTSSFHVVHSTRTAANCTEMTNACVKRSKLLFYLVKYANLWRCHPCCLRKISGDTSKGVSNLHILFCTLLTPACPTRTARPARVFFITANFFSFLCETKTWLGQIWSPFENVDLITTLTFLSQSY